MEFARSVVNDRILDLQRVRIERVDRGRVARADHHFVIFVGQRRRIRRGDAFALPAERQRSLSQRERGIIILERRGADRGLHHVETLEREHRTLGSLAQQQQSPVVGRGDAEREFDDLGARRTGGFEIALEIAQLAALVRKSLFGSDNFVINVPLVGHALFVVVRKRHVGRYFEVFVLALGIARLDARHGFDIGRNDFFFGIVAARYGDKARKGCDQKQERDFFHGANYLS